MGGAAAAPRPHERAPRAGDRVRPHEWRGAALVGLNPARVLAGALRAGEPVFGVFAPGRRAYGRARVDTAPHGGAGTDTEPDFVFYDLETAPWDVEALRAFCTAMRTEAAWRPAAGLEGGGEATPPATLLRIPPVAGDADAARVRIAEAVAAGIDGLILPQVESPEEVAVAVEGLRAAGRRLWPGDAEADTLLVVQIESRAAVAVAQEILGADGVAVGLPGQKDLRASYEGDEGAVQEAVEAVRAACDGLGLACGVTAGPEDVAARLEQGFRFIIATAPEAVAVGRALQGAWKS